MNHTASELTADQRAAAIGIGVDPDWLGRVLNRPQRAASAHLRPDLGDVTAKEARILMRLLPPQVRSARGITPITLINVALYRARHGTAKWRGGAPAQYGDADLLRQRFKRWLESGIWMALLDGVRASELSDDRKAEFELVRQMVQAEVRRADERHG